MYFTVCIIAAVLKMRVCASRFILMHHKSEQWVNKTLEWSFLLSLRYSYDLSRLLLFHWPSFVLGLMPAKNIFHVLSFHYPWPLARCHNETGHRFVRSAGHRYHIKDTAHTAECHLQLFLFFFSCLSYFTCIRITASNKYSVMVLFAVKVYKIDLWLWGECSLTRGTLTTCEAVEWCCNELVCY